MYTFSHPTIPISLFFLRLLGNLGSWRKCIWNVNVRSLRNVSLSLRFLKKKFKKSCFVAKANKQIILRVSSFFYLSTEFKCLCLSSCMCGSECLPFCCCTVITSLPQANGSPVCWFCLVLFQWFFFSGRMSALCAWPSLRTLDVILSTWSLHYLLSSTMLPSRCSATWNAWLASSLKPSWNCVLKR